MISKNCSIILGSASVALFGYLYYIRICYNYLKSLGYDGPRPKFLIGNLLEFVSEKNSFQNSNLSHYSKTLQRWTHKFGKIYGFYEGHSPVLVLADPDLVADVFLNQNKLVTFRRSFPMSKKSSDPNADIFVSNGIRWLRLRYGLEKIMLNSKNNAKCLEYADTSFMNTFTAQADLCKGEKEIDICRQSKYFMIQAIFTVIFGTELNNFLQKKPHIHTVFKRQELEDSKLAEANNLYFTRAVCHKFDEAFEDFETFSILKFLAMITPELSFVWRLCDQFKFFFNSYIFHVAYFADPMSWFYSNFIQKHLIIYTQENDDISKLRQAAENTESYLSFGAEPNRAQVRLQSQSQNLNNFINRKQFCYLNSFLNLTYIPILKYTQNENGRRMLNSVRDLGESRRPARLPSLSKIDEIKKKCGDFSSSKREENRARLSSIDRFSRPESRSRLKSSTLILNDLESEDFENWKLTVNEALSNTLLMFFAGYETTSTAITFCCKAISTMPEQREKLLDEISQNWEKLKFNLEKFKIKPARVKKTSSQSEVDTSVDLNDSEDDDVFEDEKKPTSTNSLDEWNDLYEALENLKYLDMFVKEVLRMYPIANSMVSRKCVVDNLIISNGSYRIPKDMNVVVDVLSIHYDPLWWGPVDPKNFYPERFLTERHPAAWLAFGIGSRKCLGVKLAMSQIKLFVVRLLQNYIIDEPSVSDSKIRVGFADSVETKDILFTQPTSPVVVSITPKINN
ncbi:cytochrome P450 3A29-like [Brachionus plicatilis]|uniref:Cytochrome P450 3A29-like n=1 Tax=Brachionus plicatilis TaxID=10195 RepID=A0A3M7PWM9_BRAPC|nr:cytochrome P450 3A29-like [Brachionus plicatilis]